MNILSCSLTVVIDYSSLEGCSILWDTIYLSSSSFLGNKKEQNYSLLIYPILVWSNQLKIYVTTFLWDFPINLSKSFSFRNPFSCSSNTLNKSMQLKYGTALKIYRKYSTFSQSNIKSANRLANIWFDFIDSLSLW